MTVSTSSSSYISSLPELDDEGMENLELLMAMELFNYKNDKHVQTILRNSILSRERNKSHCSLLDSSHNTSLTFCNSMQLQQQQQQNLQQPQQQQRLLWKNRTVLLLLMIFFLFLFGSFLFYVTSFGNHNNRDDGHHHCSTMKMMMMEEDHEQIMISNDTTDEYEENHAMMTLAEQQILLKHYLGEPFASPANVRLPSGGNPIDLIRLIQSSGKNE